MLNRYRSDGSRRGDLTVEEVQIIVGIFTFIGFAVGVLVGGIIYS